MKQQLSIVQTQQDVFSVNQCSSIGLICNSQPCRTGILACRADQHCFTAFSTPLYVYSLDSCFVLRLQNLVKVMGNLVVCFQSSALHGVSRCYDNANDNNKSSRVNDKLERHDAVIGVWCLSGFHGWGWSSVGELRVRGSPAVISVP